VQGAANQDGRGPSIWDTFSHIPGKTHNGDTGDYAINFYHQWRDDIALMRSLGIRNFRFSLSWTRLYPTGNVSEPNWVG
jgi:beta-glucosidase/6-phospho-beta-glucosidase/beta-galactosidase